VEEAAPLLDQSGPSIFTLFRSSAASGWHPTGPLFAMLTGIHLIKSAVLWFHALCGTTMRQLGSARPPGSAPFFKGDRINTQRSGLS